MPMYCCVCEPMETAQSLDDDTCGGRTANPNHVAVLRRFTLFNESFPCNESSFKTRMRFKEVAKVQETRHHVLPWIVGRVVAAVQYQCSRTAFTMSSAGQPFWNTGIEPYICRTCTAISLVALLPAAGSSHHMTRMSMLTKARIAKDQSDHSSSRPPPRIPNTSAVLRTSCIPNTHYRIVPVRTKIEATHRQDSGSPTMEQGRSCPPSKPAAQRGATRTARLWRSAGPIQASSNFILYRSDWSRRMRS